ncbi:stage II sporulation protein R [Neobacillus drentensis]
MRSKMVVWGYLIVLSLGTMLSLYMPKTEAAAKESIVIPGEAIRLRILANSDFEKDQAIKRKVRDAVNAQITLWVQDLTSMQEARKVINAKLPEIQAIAEKVVREQESDQSVKVEFGKVQFPTKLYGQFLYPAGEYQAILITLGSGEGANWWCVLYPPLCFLDFSNGVAVGNGFEEEKKAKAKTVTPAKSAAKVEKVKAEVDSGDKPKEVEVKTEVEEKVATVNKEVKEKATTVNEEDKKMPERLIEKDAPVFNAIEIEVDEEPVKLAKKDAPVYTSEDEKPVKLAKKDAPVYTAEDEEPVQVKFFVVEMWEKMFN